MNTKAFSENLKNCCAALKLSTVKQLCFLHHNDADGLSSAAIWMSTFERLGVHVHRFCLEKPYPEALKRIFQERHEDVQTFVFADFASGMIPIIESLLLPHQEVFIFDHHGLSPVTRDAIYIANPLDQGFSGAKEASASTVAFYAACAIDQRNKDLAGLGILGALGDGQLAFDGTSAQGLNADVLTKALDAGVLRKEKQSEKGSALAIQLAHKDWISCQELVHAINLLGSLRYFQSGPDKAIKFLRDSGLQALREEVAKVQQEWDEKLAQFFASVVLKERGSIQYFFLPQDFEHYGVKTVGLVCEALIKHGKVGENAYLLGFQRMPQTIPGLGNFPSTEVKVSARLGSKLWQDVQAGTHASIVELFAKVVPQCGGFLDACHPHAGACVISEESIEDFVMKLSAQLS